MLILIATGFEGKVTRNTKINMVVTVFTTCVPFFDLLELFLRWTLDSLADVFRDFVKHSSLGPSSAVAEKSAKKYRQANRADQTSGETGPSSAPVHYSTLFAHGNFLCPFTPFTPFFAIFSPQRSLVLWGSLNMISGLPKGVRERG